MAEGGEVGRGREREAGRDRVRSPHTVRLGARFQRFVGASAAAGVALVALREVARVEVESRASDSFLAAHPELLAAVPLPTLGEWGMLFATLSLLAAGTSVILRRRRR